MSINEILFNELKENISYLMSKNCNFNDDLKFGLLKSVIRTYEIYNGITLEEYQDSEKRIEYIKSKMVQELSV